MYVIDNRKKCQIYNSTLYQDLEDHEIYEDSGGVYLLYNKNTSDRADIYSNWNAIESYIDTSITSQDLWLPAIINTEDNIYYRPTFNKQSIYNPILGITDTLWFNANFKNWDILNSDSEPATRHMTSNWYITSSIPFFQAEYGLLFWYKFNSIKSDSVFKLSNIPDGSVIKNVDSLSFFDSSSIPAGTECIKLNNYALKVKNIVSNIIRPSGFDFWQDKTIFDLRTSSNFDIDTSTFTYNAAERALTKGGNEYTMWISDGEVFSYFDGKVDRLRSRSRSLVSKTYLSPMLMPIYREVYNTLTLRRSKSITPYLSKKQALCLQKLCYYISTFPLVDRITLDILNQKHIYDSVQAYLDSSQTDQSSEITELKNIINIISLEYKKYNLSNNFSRENNNINYINTKKQLFKKILYKYGAMLDVKWYTTHLRYKHQLTNGPHCIIGLDTYNVFGVPETTAEDDIYNSFGVDIGNIHYSTDVSSSKSLIIVSGDNFTTGVEIPLVDIAVKRDPTTPFYLGSGFKKDFSAPETVFKDIYPNGDNYNTTYYWEQISGPKCLRFTDYNKDQFRVMRYTTSTDYNPDVYIRESGTYQIKCTRNSNGVVESDDIIISTDPNQQLDDIDPTSLSSVVNNKIINCVPRKLGFHRNGIVWFIDTDNYIRDDNTYRNTADFNELNTFRLKDIKIYFADNQPNFVPMETGGSLTLKFRPETEVNAISLENVRFGENEYNQCVSFYEEKIIRDPNSPFLPILGSSNFTRDVEYDYNLAYYDDDGFLNKFITLKKNPADISTASSPIIRPYGGYDTAKVDKIGIKIPTHPDPGCKLPILYNRNEITEPPITSGIICHLKEIHPTGDHYINFDKGFFHPTSGWIVGTGNNTPYTNFAGRSVVIADKLSEQKTFTFSGPGFYNIRSSWNTANTYKSTIKVTETITPESEQYDHRYGKKSYNIDNPKLDRNFVIEDTVSDWTSMYDFGTSCGQASRIYGFPSSGTVDSLYIKDIEIKLNFLNYANPKNLIIYLDIINSGITTPSTSVLFADNRPITSFSSNTDLSSYLSNLTSMNFHVASNISRIYLLNQEHISNYGGNFSIKFSDNGNKNLTTNKQNYTYSTTEGTTSKIYNYDTIRPTLYPTGYNDIDGSLYAGVLRTNKINDMLNSFLKIRDIPLKDTQFVLNVVVLNPIEHTNKVMDNLLINDMVAGNKRTENILQSNTLGNSLCSWEVKVHTDVVRDNSNKDVLGMVNYNGFIENNILSSGYNYIGDFSSSRFLIPPVNINAPYGYLSNINTCSYDDISIGNNISYTPPQFPSLMPYFLATMGVMIGGSAGLVGVLGGIYGLQQTFENGARDDPIINYFIETRLSDQTETQDSQQYKPIYSQKDFGSADRAILCISNDGVYWYNVNVPIFRLSNTPKIKKQQYKYIKLYDNSVPGISNFQYKVIKNYNDLDLAPIVQKITNPVGSYSGVGAYIVGDMLLLTNETDAANNGYYIVQEGAWIRVPSLSSNHFLQKNNIGNSFLYSNLSGGTHILIDGIRAYNFFDKGETIVLKTNLGNTNSTISDKSHIQTSSGVKTVLTLSTAVAVDGIIYKDINNANVILLYNDKIKPVNSDTSWMLEKTRSELRDFIYPHVFTTAFGEGSLGAGTDQLNSEILYRISLTDNEILLSNELLNNQCNDKLKYNQIEIVSTGENPTTTLFTYNTQDDGLNLVKGYSYSISQLVNKFYDPSLAMVSGSGINIDRARSSVFHPDISNQNFFEIKSDKLKGPDAIPIIGYVHIQNDFKIDIKDSGDSNYALNDYKYWFHIDPDQECSLNDELSPKILKATRIKAIPTSQVNNEAIVPGLDSHITPSPFTINSVVSGVDENFHVEGLVYTYETTEAARDKEKAIWPTITNWSGGETFYYGSLSDTGDSKKMMVSRLNSNNDMMICIEEEYIRPPGTLALKYGKVSDRIDLSSTDTLRVKFRNIPRKLRNVDSEDFDKYVYDTAGNLIKSSKPPSSVGHIANNFACWHCIDPSGKYLTNIPAYYKVANEMRYRAFYGSVDGIENKNTIYLDSKDDWEWIPYEFFSPPCSIVLDTEMSRYGGSFTISAGGHNSLPLGEYPGGLYSIDGDTISFIAAYVRTWYDLEGNVITNEVTNMLSDGWNSGAFIDTFNETKGGDPGRLKYYKIGYASNQNFGVFPLDDNESYAEITCFDRVRDVSKTFYTEYQVKDGRSHLIYSTTIIGIYSFKFIGTLQSYNLFDSTDPDADPPVLQNGLIAINNVSNGNGIVRIFRTTQNLYVVPPISENRTLLVNSLGTFSYDSDITAKVPSSGIVKVRLLAGSDCNPGSAQCSYEGNIISTITDDEFAGNLTMPDKMADVRMIITGNVDAKIDITLQRVPCNG